MSKDYSGFERDYKPMEDVLDFCKIDESLIAARECRFAYYIPPPSHEHADMHYVKEAVHLKDGSVIPNVKLVFDRKRPFWITRKGFRNHQQHKEWERIERLQEFASTERAMAKNVARALGMPYLRDLRGCLDVPYVYGIDIMSTAVIKEEYIRTKSHGKRTAFTVCEMDIEANMEDDEDETPNMCSIMMGPTYGKPARCVTWITKEFAAKRKDFLARVEEKTQEILTPIIDEFRATSSKKLKFEAPVYEIEYESHIVENDMAMWFEAFKRVHEWGPDFLSIWNMTYEIGQLQKSCDRHGVRIEDVICDPRIPMEYRYYFYKEGKAVKETSSGKSMPVSPAARWHYVEAPMSFYIIDQMCVYKQTRSNTQEEPSYKLDAILRKELKLSKLKFEAADHIQPLTADWHAYMQKHHPVEYTVYNRFDVIGPKFIDEKVKDLSFVFPTMAATSDFRRFASQPRRSCDRLHWYLLALEDGEKRVMGCTSKSLVDDFDEDTLSRSDWVITLPSALISQEGLKVIKEIPAYDSRLYSMVGDRHSRSPLKILN